MKRKIKLAVAVVVAILIWHIVAVKIDQKIILATPIDVLKRLWGLLGEKDFASTVLFSFGRIATGFLQGFLLGILLAMLAGKWETAEILFKPFEVSIKSIPVASFVVLSLFWFGTEKLAVFISFLMVLPIVYTNVLQGIKSIDPKMTQMAKVFKIPFARRIRYLWLPSVKPFLLSGSSVAAGLAWKSGIAAEIIGVPKGSIGESLYYSKVYLDTETLLAWTGVIIILSVCTEKLFMFVLKCIFGMTEITILPQKNVTEIPAETNCDSHSEINSIVLENISKSYGEEKVIESFSYSFGEGVNVVFGKSGCGKTTLLNLILKIESPDSGEIKGATENVSVVFQEDRLCEDFTPLGNIMAVCPKEHKNHAVALLREMGLGDSLGKKISKLSGGMKRRVSICRAICAPCDVLIMDEPFKGLDEKTKEAVIETVKRYTKNKIVILVTHDETEAQKMEANNILCLTDNL